jgi:hypothetical protein
MLMEASCHHITMTDPMFLGLVRAKLLLYNSDSSIASVQNFNTGSDYSFRKVKVFMDCGGEEVQLCQMLIESMLVVGYFNGIEGLSPCLESL